jgi:Holliday junction resolvase RusA-like endonuclease
VVSDFRLPALARRAGCIDDCRPDLDNYIKALLDAGTGVLWVDDGQVWACQAVKLRAPRGQPAGIMLRASDDPILWRAWGLEARP